MHLVSLYLTGAWYSFALKFKLINLYTGSLLIYKMHLASLRESRIRKVNVEHLEMAKNNVVLNWFDLNSAH